MINKGKLFDTISILAICSTILIIIFLVVSKIKTASAPEIFYKEVASVYDLVIKQNKSDIENGYDKEEYSFYKSIAITGGKKALNYIAEFNQETNDLEYFCITDGNLKMALEGKINQEIIASSQIVNSKIECEFRNEK